MSGKKRRLKNFNRKTIFVALAVLVAFFVFHAYAAFAEKTSIHFLLPDGQNSQSFQVDIADDNQERAKGLMFVKELANKEGMLFIFPEEKIQSFWMKNTYISLDMIFINSEKKVVGILHDVPPLNEKQRKINSPSRYVLELAAGSARQYKITEGSQLIYSP